MICRVRMFAAVVFGRYSNRNDTVFRTIETVFFQKIIGPFNELKFEQGVTARRKWIDEWRSQGKWNRDIVIQRSSGWVIAVRKTGQKHICRVQRIYEVDQHLRCVFIFRVFTRQCPKCLYLLICMYYCSRDLWAELPNVGAIGIVYFGNGEFFKPSNAIANMPFSFRRWRLVLQAESHNINWAEEHTKLCRDCTCDCCCFHGQVMQSVPLLLLQDFNCSPIRGGDCARRVFEGNARSSERNNAGKCGAISIEQK